MNEKTLIFLILNTLLESESIKEPEKTRKIKKHRFYLDTEEIFPNREMTATDVMFIEYILDKLKIDLESDTQEEFIVSTNQVLYLIRGIMREYDTFLSNGKSLRNIKRHFPPGMDWI